MVVNLEESVAVTQNFVSPLGLGPVLAFLRTGTTIPGLVSGCEHRRGAVVKSRARALLRLHPLLAWPVLCSSRPAPATRMAHCVAFPTNPHARREGLYRRFLAALELHRPEVLRQLEEREARCKERAERDGRLGRIFREAAAQRAEATGCAPDHGVGGAANGGGQLCNSDTAAAGGGFTFGFDL
jgi:hypothetical protein